MVLLFLLIFLKLVLSAIYHVDPSCNISGSGVSWQNPIKYLDTALIMAQSSIDEIWLKGGKTYIPNFTKDRSQCFKPSNGIKIYGGFIGRETNINQRQLSSPELQSILSGDIGVIGDNSDNCYHVIQYKQTLYLDNIIIQYGNANANINLYNTQNDVLHRYGGAIITDDVAQQTNLYLNNVIIRNNTALNGAGLWITSRDGNNVNVYIQNSIFKHNIAINGDYEGGYGGAIYQMFLANLYLDNVQFQYNYAAFRGGAIYQVSTKKRISS